MLKWVKQKLGVAPDAADEVAFATDAYLRAFLAELPASQPYVCIHEIASVFENLLAWPLPDARRREVMRELDEFAQRQVRVAWHMLFPRTDEAQMLDQAWTALTRYYAALADAGARLVPVLAGDEDPASLTHAANQALNAFARHDLLLRLRQRTPDAAFWRSAYDLYRRCESAKVAHRRIESGYLKQSSCGRLFARIVAFECGPLESVSPPQAHAHFQFVAHFADDLSLGTTLPETHGFVLDLAQSVPPRRARADVALTASTRFLNVARMQAHAQVLLRDATRDRALPDWMVEVECGVAAYMRLLNHLVRTWSAQPPNRRHNRVRTQAEFLVCHGFSQVRRMVAAAEYARQEAKREEMRYIGSEILDPKRFDEVHFGRVEGQVPDMPKQQRMGPKPRPAIDILDKVETSGDKEQTEHWKVEDLSEHGFGAIPAVPVRWARVGVLIAFRQPTLARWNLGIVRRVTSSAQGRQMLGIEVFRGETAVARVHVLTPQEAESRNEFSATEEMVADAILLSAGDARRIVLPRDRFAAGARAIVHIGGNQGRVLLDDALELGDDYALCPVRTWTP